MHKTQRQLLDLISNNENLGSQSLRKIAEMVGANGQPQTVKHHLEKLRDLGLIQMNLRENILKLVKKGKQNISNSVLFSVPVVGSANCGPATIYADQNIQGYLKVSPSLLPANKHKLFALVADGDSMNNCKINGKSIEDGDYVLVDSEYKSFKDNDVVVAVIDDMATIKEYNKNSDSIVLKALSTKKYLPIYLHQDDNFILNGKVVDIIKS